MKDAASHVEKARKSLASGHYLLTGGYAEAAGRDAYLVAFHAAQAFIMARTGKQPKTHSGTRSEFARLARDESRISHEYASFLGRAYALQPVADYDDGAPVTLAEATAALAMAPRFLDAVIPLL